MGISRSDALDMLGEIKTHFNSSQYIVEVSNSHEYIAVVETTNGDLYLSIYTFSS